jgi:Tol biopolymer transport system component
MAELPNRLTWSGTPDEVIVTDDPRGRSDNLSLYRISIRTGERHLLDEAPPDATDIWPQTSPDRQWIAYLRLRGKDAELRVIPAAGGDSRLIIAQSGIRALAWGSDSKHIVCGFGQSSFDQIREIPLDGGSFHKASFSLQDQSSDLAFSPDGRKVSFVRGSRDSNVWRISTDGAAPLKLTSSTRADEDAVYSPDGMSIAFSSSRTGDYEIWTAASDGTHLRKLTSLGGFSASPSWSPDGRYIAFDSNLLEKPQIRVVPVEGGTARLVAGDMSAMVPSWSRDGRWIYFSSKVTGANELWRVPSGGGKAQQITRRGGFESRESPDGKYLYYSKNGADGIWRMVLPPSAGRAEEQVAAFAPAVQFRCWDVADAGVYVARPGKPPEIHMTPFARGPEAAVVKLTRDLPFYGRCISARPDGRAFLLSIDDAIHREIFVADLPN